MCHLSLCDESQEAKTVVSQGKQVDLGQSVTSKQKTLGWVQKPLQVLRLASQQGVYPYILLPQNIESREHEAVSGPVGKCILLSNEEP